MLPVIGKTEIYQNPVGLITFLLNLLIKINISIEDIRSIPIVYIILKE